MDSNHRIMDLQSTPLVLLGTAPFALASPKDEARDAIGADPEVQPWTLPFSPLPPGAFAPDERGDKKIVA